MMKKIIFGLKIWLLKSKNVHLQSYTHYYNVKMKNLLQNTLMITLNLWKMFLEMLFYYLETMIELIHLKLNVNQLKVYTITLLMHIKLNNNFFIIY